MKAAYINGVVDDNTIVYGYGYEDWAPISKNPGLRSALHHPLTRAQRQVKRFMLSVSAGKTIPLTTRKPEWKGEYFPPVMDLVDKVEPIGPEGVPPPEPKPDKPAKK